MAEPDSYGELVAFCRREHPRLVGALTLYCGDPDVAADAAQEALVRTVENWPKVSRMAAPGAWTHRVGMNLTTSWFRRRGAERRAASRQAQRLADATTPDLADVATVRDAVLALPARQRRVVVLRFYAGFSVGEVAAAVGVSEQAAAALTYRATRFLRERLADSDLEVTGDAR